MTPLEFFISVNNSSAKDGLEEIQSKVDSFKESTNELYEGPAREMKIRTEIKGMIQDIASGQSPMNAFISTMQRLSEVFKFALPAAIGAAALGAFVEAAFKAKGSLIELMNAYRDVMETDLSSKSVSGLEKMQDETQKLIDKIDNMGMMEKVVAWFAGSPTAGIRAALVVEQERAAVLEDQTLAAKQRAETEKMSANEAIRTQGEIDSTRLEFEDRIKEARAKGQHDHADALQDEETAAIDKIAAHRAETVAAQDAKTKEQLAELQEASMSDIDALKDKRDRLQVKVDTDAPTFEEGSTKLQDQIELANVQKEITAKEAEQKKAAAQAKKEADEKDAALRQSVLKSQFEALSKEGQVIVLRAAQAALQKNIIEAGKVNDEHSKLVFEKQLADVTKQLREADQRANPWAGIQADDALRGNMSAGSFNRVTNDAANRAEKQRDDMVNYLKIIATRGNAGDLGAF